MRIVYVEISYCLVNISKMSFKEVKYFSKWKVGKVKIFFKIGVREECGIYRFLVMLSIFSKIIKLLYVNFLDLY